MRRYWVGVATAALLAGSVIAGCGGAGGGAGSFQFDPPPLGPTPPPQQTINFSLPSFAAGDQGVVVVTPVAGDEFDQAQNLFDFTALPSGFGRFDVAETEFRPAAAPAPSAELDQHEFCATTDEYADMIQRMVDEGSVPGADELIPHRSVQGRYDGLAEGATDQIINPNTGELIVITKMLGDADTVHCNILAKTDFTAGPNITKAMALRIAAVFDSDNPFDPIAPGAIGIYDRMTGLFGTEWRTNPLGGRDGDVRVNLVILDPADMPGAAGFVQTADSFPRSYYELSNEGEFIYLNANLFQDDTATDLELFGSYHVIAHELLHLIHTNRKMIQDGTFPNFSAAQPVADTVVSLNERFSLLEGFAETGATLTGFGVARAQDFGATGGAAQISQVLIDEFLKGPGFNFFNFAFERGGADFKFYGEGHLLGLYIAERFGEATFGQIIRSPDVGIFNLSKVTNTAGEDLFHGFHLALYGDTVGAPAPNRFTAFKIAGPNAVRTNGDGGPPTVTFPETMPFDIEDMSPTSVTRPVWSPWSTRFIQYNGGSGGPLNIQVTLPLRGRASLIHESPAGTFSSVQ